MGAGGVEFDEAFLLFISIEYREPIEAGKED